MDVDLNKDSIEIIKHELEEVEGYFETIKTVSQRFIDAVNDKLQNSITKEYTYAVDDGDGNITFLV